MVCFERLPKISNFLCCISLETGSIILGLVTLLGAWTVFLGLALLEFQFNESEYDEKARSIGLAIGILLVPIASASLLLLFGTMKRSTTMICFYLWLDVILTLLSGATMICLIILVIIYGPSTHGTALLIFIIVFVLKVYFFISVNSHYVELVNHRDHPMFRACLDGAAPSAPRPSIVAQSNLYPHIYYSPQE